MPIPKLSHQKNLTLNNDFQVTFPLLLFCLPAFSPFQSALCTQAGALYIALKLSGGFKNASLVKFFWKQLDVVGLLQSGTYRDCEGRQGVETAAQVDKGNGIVGTDFPWHFHNFTNNFPHVLWISPNFLPTPAAFSMHIWASVGLLCAISLVWSCLHTKWERWQSWFYFILFYFIFKTQHRVVSVVCLNR